MPSSRPGEYGYFQLYADYLRRYRGRLSELPAAIRRLSSTEQQVFKCLIRGAIDREAIAASLHLEPEHIEPLIAGVRAALLQEGWEQYWYWLGSKEQETRNAFPLSTEFGARRLVDAEEVPDAFDTDGAWTISAKLDGARALLAACLHGLPSLRCHIVVLFFHQGLSAKAILRALGRAKLPGPRSVRAVFHELEQAVLHVRRKVAQLSGNLPTGAEVRDVLRAWDLEVLTSVPASLDGKATVRPEVSPSESAAPLPSGKRARTTMSAKTRERRLK